MLEGFFYGIVGGIIGASILIIPWYIILYYTQGTEFATLINSFLRSFEIQFVGIFNLLFILIYYSIHITVGGLIGIISSLSAIKKYLE